MNMYKDADDGWQQFLMKLKFVSLIQSIFTIYLNKLLFCYVRIVYNFFLYCLGKNFKILQICDEAEVIG